MAIARDVDAWGRVIFQGDDALELLLCGHDLHELLIKPSASIREYNQHCLRHDKTEFVLHAPPPPIGTAQDELDRRRSAWFMPDAYKDLPVRQIALDRCASDVERARVNLEMDLFEARGWLPVLRLMLYLVDSFRERNIVWGVGRGSSVASYVLFLFGVHKIDSLAYELDIHEFLK